MITSRFNKDEAAVQRDYMTANIRRKRSITLVSLLAVMFAVFILLIFVATPFRASPLFMPLFPPVLSFLIFAPAMAGAGIYFRMRLWKVAEPSERRPMMQRSSKTGLVMLVLALMILVVALPVSPLFPSPNAAESLLEKSDHAQILNTSNIRLQFQGSGVLAGVYSGVSVSCQNNLSLDFYLLTKDDADGLGEDLAQVYELSIAKSLNATSFDYDKDDLDSGMYTVVIVNPNDAVAEISYTIHQTSSPVLTSTMTLFAIVYIIMAAWWTVHTRKIAAQPELPAALPPALTQMPVQPERPTVQRAPMGVGTASGLASMPGPSYPAAPPETQTGGTRMAITCPRCSTTFDVFRGAGPTRIKCPNCGKEGTLAGLPMPPREPEAPPVQAPAAAEPPYIPRVERPPPQRIPAPYNAPELAPQPASPPLQEEPAYLMAPQPPEPARPPAAPARPPMAPSQIPEAPAIPEEPAIPVTPPPRRNIACPRCKQIFSIDKVEGPQHIRCPHCGKEGTIGARKTAAPAPAPEPAPLPPAEVYPPPVESSRPAARPAPKPAPAGPPATPKMISCPACRKPFPVAETRRPLQVRCPNCGKEGMLRK